MLLVTETATILFTDLVGSTELRIALGESRFAEVMNDHDALLNDAIASQGGTVVKHMGDGLMATFAAACQGVAAAVEIQHRTATYNDGSVPAIGIRVGVAAGDVAERFGDYHGVAVVEASRLCALASPGQILASESVRRLAGSHGGFEYISLGQLDLKGLPGHASVAVRWTDEAPVDAPLGSVTGNLPAGVGRFIGRRDDLTALAELVRNHRCVTLTGTAGCGKTRLALQVASLVAEEFPDAVWLVPLADLDDENFIAETTTAVLGLRNAGDPLVALRSNLARQTTLVVLDNCEHVIEATADLVGDLLAACPNLHVLATSREALQVPGECEYGLEPLPLAEATELFLERRPQATALGEVDRDAVTRICEAVDGIPLAIELAAARLRVLSAVQVADRLDDQLTILTAGGRSRPDRQQTLRAALDWSHDLLTQDERVVFRRLGVFAGGFTLEAAEAIVTGEDIDGTAVADLVERLAARSLLVVAPDADLRLRMLEPVRQYACDQLAASGEHRVVEMRHLSWVRALTAGLGRGFFADQRGTTARAAVEHANLCRALDFAFRTSRLEDATRVIAATVYPWIMIGQPDGKAWVDRTLAACPSDAPARTRGDAVFAAAMFAVNEGDEARSLPLLREALTCFEAAGRHRSHAWALTWFGRAGRAGTGEVDGRTPEDWFAQALAEFTSLRDFAGMGWSLALLARCALRAHDLDLAEQRAQSALDLAETHGIHQVAAGARRWLAVIAQTRGDTNRAEDLIAHATSQHEDSGDKWHQAIALATAASMATARRDLDRAAASLFEAMDIVQHLPEDESSVSVLVAALDFLLQVERRTEVASVVSGLADPDYTLLLRGALIQGPELLPEWFAEMRTDPIVRHSLRDALRVTSRSMDAWSATRSWI